MFSNFFIRRPVFASVCALLIILAGVAVLPTLPIAQFPNLAPPQVSVTSSYIGRECGHDSARAADQRRGGHEVHDFEQRE